MRFLAAIVCLLLSAAALFFAVAASGSLQDAPLLRSQQVWVLPYTVGFVVFGIVSIFLFVKLARRGL